MKFNANIDIFFQEEFVLVELFDAFAKEIIRKALKAYLYAALAKIPIRTGFLRGSFSQIENYFGVVAAKIQGSSPRSHEFYEISNRRYILKTYTSGIQFNTLPEQVIKQQGDTLLIELDTDINYYAINDEKRDWHSVNDGTQAFVNTLEFSVNEFPEIEEMLATFTISLSDSNLTTTKKSDAVLNSRTLALKAF